MTRRFGPWSTSLGGRPGAGLATFWRHRMGRLASARACEQGLSRRDLLKLGAGGVAAMAWPTLRPRPASGLDDPADPAATGRIYLFANFEPEGGPAVRGLMMIDPETGAWSKVADAEGFPMLSPDGKRLAYVEFGEPVDGFVKGIATWLVDLGGDEMPRKLADRGGNLTWSPDGKTLVMSQMRVEGAGDDERVFHDTWKVNLDGSGLVEMPIPNTEGVADWSPDGRWLACVSDRHPPHGSGYQIYLMRPDGTELRRMTEGKGLNVQPRFSPDGKTLLYHHQRGKDSLWSVDLDGNNRRLILDEEEFKSPDSACWSPDGKRLALTMIDWKPGKEGRKYIDDPRDMDSRLVILDADGNNPRRLPLPPALHLGDPQWL